MITDRLAPKMGVCGVATAKTDLAWLRYLGELCKKFFLNKKSLARPETNNGWSTGR